MEKYVLGVDGGGTKTEVVLVNRKGTVIAITRGGSTNYQAIGGEGVKLELSTLFRKILKKTNVSTGKIARLFLGLAGAGRKSDQNAIIKLFDGSEFEDKISVKSDAIIALTGAFSNRPGIIIIAGTGAICFGKNSKNKIVRAGGWGYLLGDEGSGYFVGRNAITSALKDFDGRGEKTSLRNVVETRYNLESIEEVIPLIYQNKINRVAIADLAPLVFEQAKQGDQVAHQIVKKTGSGNKVLIKDGNLAEAMRASATFPLVFSPVQKDSMLLVDGGLINNIPVDEVRAGGMDIVIAINATSNLHSKNQLQAPWVIADQVTTIMQRQKNKEQQNKADVLIQLNMENRKSGDFLNIDELINEGRKETNKKISLIKNTLKQHEQKKFPDIKYQIRNFDVKGCQTNKQEIMDTP
jgi:N-acetylglucosamine kinase-like BadF-type ATPase